MFGLLLALIACDVPYDVPRVPVDAGAYVAPDDGWARAREELVKARACLADVAVYCVTDDALVDAAIQRDLDENHHGHMPTNERWLEEHIGRARAEWNNSMKSEPRDIEALVEANWTEPRTAFHKGRADVFLHVPPGRLTLFNGHWKGRSPLVDDGELTTEELVRQLVRWAELRPKAKVVHLILDVPQPRKGFERFDVRWFRARSEVVITRPRETTAWSTGPDADLAAYAEGRASLRTDALLACTGGDPDTPPDCEAAPEPRRKGKGRRRRSPPAE